jgi:hypothetical protein
MATHCISRWQIILLANYPDDACVDRLRSAFADVTAGRRVQDIALSATGLFHAGRVGRRPVVDPVMR